MSSAMCNLHGQCRLLGVRYIRVENSPVPYALPRQRITTSGIPGLSTAIPFFFSCHTMKALQLTFSTVSYSATQADVACFKALKSAPDAQKFPNAARWYKHIATFEDEFSTLSGDASKPYTVYGPEASELTLNPAKAPAAEDDDDDVDLFGSDDEEEDAEAVRVREERLAEYRKKKEAKPKTIAKSVVTLDVKPWGTLQFRPIIVVLAARRHAHLKEPLTHLA